MINKQSKELKSTKKRKNKKKKFIRKIKLQKRVLHDKFIKKYVKTL